MFDCSEKTLNALIKNGVIITGTDTNVGKTFFSIHCLNITKGTYWKPVQSGLPRDREIVQKATGLNNTHFLKETYRFTQALSPHEAANYDKKKIIIKKISFPKRISHLPLIIEGAGGILVPLNKKYLMIDLFRYLNLPTIVVARSTLGTINHTLMTLECLRRRKILVLGIVMVGPHMPANEKAISFYGKVSIIGRSK